VTTPTAPHPALKKYYADEGQRQHFVTTLFDRAARYYDRSCGLGSLGSGQFYRRWVLRHYGLRPGMAFLDVATGTGLVARGASRILSGRGVVVGLDPSEGMLRAGRGAHSALLVQGMVEDLPFGDGAFDFLCLGYALRHAADLRVAFAECLRVLKPGGRLLILEICRPRSSAGQWLARAYFGTILPGAMRIFTGSALAEQLMRYHWDTIAACVPAAAILDVLGATGFVEVRRCSRGGVLGEYLARKPELASDGARARRVASEDRRAQRVASGNPRAQ
jgi:demethylmenaquinone methyltransferase/2-methoxy-6-polyprenyl-1,4-benzoquinol methylase